MQPPPNRELMRKCSCGEIGNEFFANFPVFWPIRACFGALAHGLGALMPPTLESFACAPSTNWTAQTSPAVGWCSWPDPGNASCDDRTDT
jgi:hypothetical protein